MPKVYNRAKVNTSTTGTGTITLGSAASGYQTFAAAGAANSDVVHYTIEEGVNWEIGTGTYSSAGPTLTRTLVQSSTGSLLNLGGAAQVFITAPASSIQGGVEITGGTITGLSSAIPVASGGTGVATLTGLVKGNGTSAFSAASAGTDYLAPAAIGTTVQAYDADLNAIAALAGTSGLLRKTAANTWSLETTAYAPLASPTFTGVPAAPTAAADTNTTQLATTAYVVAQASSTTPVVNGTAAVGTSLRYARGDHVHPTDTTRAPLSSPGLTGTPTAPTAAVDTNTTQLATTAYVVGQGYLKSATATSTYAPLASPGLTGTPTAPTAGGGTNTTQIATTAFVQTALGGAGGMTLLGTIATTSGTSQSLSGLTLTSYKQLVLVFQDVSHNDSGTQRQILLGTSTADDVVMTVTEPSTTAFTGIAWVDLNAGIGAAFVRTTNPAGIDTAITTASTSVSVAMSGGSFDAGNVRVYGVK
jgi:hypothetical protein